MRSLHRFTTAVLILLSVSCVNIDGRFYSCLSVIFSRGGGCLTSMHIFFFFLFDLYHLFLQLFVLVNNWLAFFPPNHLKALGHQCFVLLPLICADVVGWLSWNCLPKYDIHRLDQCDCNSNKIYYFVFYYYFYFTNLSLFTEEWVGNWIFFERNPAACWCI